MTMNVMRGRRKAKGRGESEKERFLNLCDNLYQSYMLGIVISLFPFSPSSSRDIQTLFGQNQCMLYNIYSTSIYIIHTTYAQQNSRSIYLSYPSYSCMVLVLCRTHTDSQIQSYVILLLVIVYIIQDKYSYKQSIVCTYIVYERIRFKMQRVDKFGIWSST